MDPSHPTQSVINYPMGILHLSQMLMASRGDRMFECSWQRVSSSQTSPDASFRQVVSGRWRLIFLLSACICMRDVCQIRASTQFSSRILFNRAKLCFAISFFSFSLQVAGSLFPFRIWRPRCRQSHSVVVVARKQMTMICHYML